MSGNIKTHATEEILKILFNKPAYCKDYIASVVDGMKLRGENQATGR
jgi:hypothetical protein